MAFGVPRAPETHASAHRSDEITPSPSANASALALMGTERARIQSASADLAGRGVIGNVHLVSNSPPAEVKQVYEPTPEQLRADIKQRDSFPDRYEGCSTRAQSTDVAPIENTCGIDLETKVPEAEKSMVRVFNSATGLGNGVYVCKSDGSFCGVITNDHVVPKGSGDVLVSQDRQDVIGNLVASDPEHDLALLKISSGLTPTPARFADGVAKDDGVFTVCQLEENKIVAAGVVADVSKMLSSDQSPATASLASLQVTFHGCSGSANFDKDGHIAGIVKGGRVLSAEHGLTGSVLLSQAKALIEGYNPNKVEQAVHRDRTGTVPLPQSADLRHPNKVQSDELVDKKYPFLHYY